MQGNLQPCQQSSIAIELALQLDNCSIVALSDLAECS